MSDPQKTIQQYLDYEFKRAVLEVINREFRELDGIQKYELLNSCVPHIKTASSKIVGELFAMRVMIDAAKDQ
jgi:hypothetical protein